jgi:hypothetical protein
MRHAQFATVIALVAMALPDPALSLGPADRPASQPAITRVADLGPSAHGHARASWHYRAAYTRWLHNEYVRAGHPVRHHCRCGKR